MEINYTSPTEDYSDNLSFAIRIFQIIEKHDLEIFITPTFLSNIHESPQEHLFLSGYLKLNDNQLEAVSELLNISNIAFDKHTLFVTNYAHGQGTFQTSYQPNTSIDGIQLKKTEEAKSIPKDEQKWPSSIEFPKINGQHYFRISWPSISLILQNAIYDSPIKNELFFIFTKHGIDTDNFIGHHTGKPQYLIANLLSMKTLEFILPHHPQFRISGKFLDLMYHSIDNVKFNMYNKSQFIKLNKLSLDTNLDPTNTEFNITTFAFLNSDFNNYIHNEVNALESLTYSKFLTKKENNILSYSAYEVINKDPNINALQVIQFMNNKGPIFGFDAKFFIEENFSRERANQLISRAKQEKEHLLRTKWGTLQKRILQASKHPFTDQIYLSLQFINKYILPYFRQTQHPRDYNTFPMEDTYTYKLPIAYKFIKLLFQKTADDFFNIPGAESYFQNIFKINVPVYKFDARFESIDGYLFTSHSNLDYKYEGHAVNLSFANTKTVINVNRNYKNSSRNETCNVIIINDSYTKQSWKPKVKAFINLIKKQYPQSYLHTYVLSPQTKIETVVLKRIFKDRALVFTYSEFIKILPKTTGKTRSKDVFIKYRLFDSSKTSSGKLATKVLSYWTDTTNLEQFQKDKDAALIVYDQKKKIFDLGNTSVSSIQADNTQRLFFWTSFLKNRVGIKTYVTGPTGIKRLQKENIEFQMLAEVLQPDVLRPYWKQFLENRIVLRNYDEEMSLTNIEKFLVNEFLGPMSALSSRADPKIKKRREEIIFYILSLCPAKFQEVVAEFFAYVYTSVDLNRFSMYNIPHSPKYVVPEQHRFDYNLVRHLITSDDYTFSEDMLSKIDVSIPRRHVERSETLNINVSNMVTDENTLLQIKQDLNLNRQAMESLMKGEYQRYMTGYLLKFIIKLYQNLEAET